MKKLTVLLIIAVMVTGVWTAARAAVPGVLADFTNQASELTNPDTRNYAYCYYDWDEDGEDELFFIQLSTAAFLFYRSNRLRPDLENVL